MKTEILILAPNAPLEPIEDWSLYYLIALILFIGLSLWIGLMQGWKMWQTPHRQAKKALKNLLWHDTKHDAYTATQLIYFLENETNRAEAKKVLQALEKYKYVRNAPCVDDDIQHLIHEFLKKTR